MSNASAHSGLGQCCLPVDRRRLEEPVELMLDAAAFGNLEGRRILVGFGSSIMPSSLGGACRTRLASRLEILRRDLSVACGGAGLIFRYTNLPLQRKEEVTGECGQREEM